MVCHTLGVDKIWHGRKPKTDIIDNTMQYLNNITTHSISSASQHFLKPRHKILIRIGVKCGVHELLSTAFGAFDWTLHGVSWLLQNRNGRTKNKKSHGRLDNVRWSPLNFCHSKDGILTTQTWLWKHWICHFESPELPCGSAPEHAAKTKQHSLCWGNLLHVQWTLRGHRPSRPGPV